MRATTKTASLALALAVALVLVPISVLAQNRTKPPPSLALTGIHFEGSSFLNTYSRGPLDLDVWLTNNTDAPMNGVKISSNVASLAPQTASVAPHASVSVHLTDVRGLPSACSPSTYALTMTNGIESHSAAFRPNPTCSFSSQVTDPWTSLLPDNVQRMDASR